MKPARWWALTGSVGLAVSFAAAAPAAAAAHPAPPAHRVALRGSLVPARERAHPAGSVAARSMVRFGLVLKLRNAAGAKTFVRQVSTPGSKLFHHYLSDAGWLSRFGPTKTEVAKAKAWLRGQGFTVGSVPKDRIFISASGTARKVEHAFGVKLGYYKVNGHRVRLANGTLTIPTSVGSAIAGTVGINQYVATTSLRRPACGQRPRRDSGAGAAAARRASATRSRARHSGHRRPTRRTARRCTRRSPHRFPTTSAATSRPSSAARTA